jgi:hypothetical protein
MSKTQTIDGDVSGKHTKSISVFHGAARDNGGKRYLRAFSLIKLTKTLPPLRSSASSA